jgi:probable HAF family extracellular repeat protein
VDGGTRYYRIATGCALAVALALTPSLVSAAPKYRIIDLGTLCGEDPSCGANALSINNLGQVVGESDSYCGGRRAFLWENGRMTDITDRPCNVQSSALDINNIGQIIFYVPPLSFLWDDGQIIPLGHLGYPDTTATAINDVAQVVGLSHVTPFQRRGFLWDQGAMLDLGSLGGMESGSVAWDINNAGQVVGITATRDDPAGRAFLWEHGVMKNLGGLGGVSSTGFGINDSSQVVGLAELPEVPKNTCFLWENGVMIDLAADRDFVYCWPESINNSGQVVGELHTAFGAPVETFLYDETNGFRNLHGLLPGEIPWTSLTPNAINEFGQIVGYGNAERATRAFLMTPIFADFNENGLTELSDFVELNACLTGPGDARTASCSKADLDRDGDVDLIDFRVFQLWFEAP